MKEGRQGGFTPFRSIKEWDPNISLSYRLSWLRVYDIPLNVWGELIFSQLFMSFRFFCGSR